MAIYTQIQKNQIFSKATRKHIHTLSAKSIGESSNVQWEIPKSRYLTSIMLLVEGTFNVVHATETTWTAKRLSPHRFLSNISLNINNGFSPYKISGSGAYLMNLINPRNTAFSTVATAAATRGANILTGLADTSGNGGEDNTIKFMIELPLTINERDYVGVINAADPTTNIVLEIDSSTILGLFASTTGYTISSISITGTPYVTSLSIPDNPLNPKNPREHLLDLSMIKLVHGQSKTIGVAGEDINQLSRGTIYRKFIVDLHSSDTALTDAQVTRFKFALNQADNIIDMTGKQLQVMNQKQLGYALPAGVWLFDFSYQGNPNYGGDRDLIDSDSLNEFWSMITFGTTGTMNFFYESLARMK